MTTATTPKSRPILFSGPMIRAILDGHKTMTRRIVKPQPHAPTAEYGDVEESEKYPGEFFQWCGGEPGPSFACPHGAVGDLLWVRESFWVDRRDPTTCVVYDATPEWGKYKNTGELVRSESPDGYRPTREECRAAMLPKFWRKRPSIFLERWASRITLRIADVRVERLGSITEADAKAEGVDLLPGVVEEPVRPGSILTTFRPLTHRDYFVDLWQRINGKRDGFSWGADPYVWVISFSRTTP